MKVQALHPGFIMPTKGTPQSGAYDIYMPEAGMAGIIPVSCPLGFSAEVPPGHVALLLPRSGVGSKYGLELLNTCGVIDPDYRGEWKATLATKNGYAFQWGKGDRILQFLIVPVATVQLELAGSLGVTARGTGGFGSTG